ncbi:MAG TPA: serine hydrolase [Planctomycetota bacterium]|nr:serine hydrolase [Planctomycetota bacterium]
MRGFGLWATAALFGCAEPSAFEDMGGLERNLRLAVARHAPEARLSAWAARMDGRPVLAVAADRPVPAASTVKVLILVEAHAQAEQGTFRWSDEVTLLDEDKVGGAGSLRRERSGSSWSWHQLARRMISESDNTASNLFVRRLGMDRVNARAAALGLTRTRLQRLFMDEEARRAGRDNVTSAEDMGRLLLAIYRKEILTPAACDAMVEALERTNRRRLAVGVPRDVAVGHKGGTGVGLRADVGWVRVPGAPYVAAVFLDGLIERPDAEVDRGVDALESAAQVLYDALGPGDL